MNLTQARMNMVKQQLRTWEVRDERVLAGFQTLPREIFIPSTYQDLAYADCALPLDQRHLLLPPKEQARLLQALAITPEDTILELGTGTGWVTALLANLGRHVYSLDSCADLSQKAATNLKKLGITNVTLLTGDLESLWNKGAPYNAITASGGSLSQIPRELKRCLAIGGRLTAIIGTAPSMEATLIKRNAENTWATDKLFETSCPRLEGITESKPFRF